MDFWDMFKFLDLYEMHECLWNKSHENYKDRKARDLAEINMLAKTNIDSPKLLRAKIRSMRGTYNIEVAKIRQSLKNCTDPQNVYKPKLAWFSRAHSFLHKNNEGDEEWETIDPAGTTAMTLGECTFQDVSRDFQEASGRQQTLQTAAEGIPTSQYSDVSQSMPVSKNFAQRRRKRIAMEQPVTISKATLSQSGNQFTLFGQHIARQLHELPIIEALQLSDTILSLITQTRLRILKGPQYNGKVRNSQVHNELLRNNSDEYMGVSISSETENNSASNLNMNKNRKTEVNNKYLQKESDTMNGLESSSEMEDLQGSTSKEYEVFGTYVTSTLRTLAPSNAVAAQNDIVQILSGQKKAHFLEEDNVTSLVFDDNCQNMGVQQCGDRDETLSLHTSSLKCIKKNTNEECDMQVSSDCSKVPYESVIKDDEYAIYGHHVGNKLRCCNRSYIEISIAQHHIDEILFNLTLGKYSPSFPHQGQSC